MKVKMMKTLAVVVATSFAIPSIAAAEDDVRLRLNWMYYGSHAGFALGKDAGYYDDSGIDIDIRSGNGSSSAHLTEDYAPIFDAVRVDEGTNRDSSFP